MICENPKRLNQVRLAFMVLLAMGVGFNAWRLHRLSSLLHAERGPKESCEPFCGRWRLTDERGRLSGWLTISGDRALRDHAPLDPCKPEVVHGELRLIWPDGFRDVLRKDNGGWELAALERNGTDWSGEPRFKLKATRP